MFFITFFLFKLLFSFFAKMCQYNPIPQGFIKGMHANVYIYLFVSIEIRALHLRSKDNSQRFSSEQNHESLI